MWATHPAQRLNVHGLKLWESEFPCPEKHRDYDTNSRDLAEFSVVAFGELRPDHQHDIRRRWQQAMLIFKS